MSSTRNSKKFENWPLGLLFFKVCHTCVLRQLWSYIALLITRVACVSFANTAERVCETYVRSWVLFNGFVRLSVCLFVCLSPNFLGLFNFWRTWPILANDGLNESLGEYLQTFFWFFKKSVFSWNRNLMFQVEKNFFRFLKFNWVEWIDMDVFYSE